MNIKEEALKYKDVEFLEDVSLSHIKDIKTKLNVFKEIVKQRSEITSFDPSRGKGGQSVGMPLYTHRLYNDYMGFEIVWSKPEWKSNQKSKDFMKLIFELFIDEIIK